MQSPGKKIKKMLLSIEIQPVFFYNTFVVLKKKKMTILQKEASLRYTKKVRGGDNAKK